MKTVWSYIVLDVRAIQRDALSASENLPGTVHGSEPEAIGQALDHVLTILAAGGKEPIDPRADLADELESYNHADVVTTQGDVVRVETFPLRVH